MISKADDHIYGISGIDSFVNTDAQGNISPLKPMNRGDMAYILSQYLQRQQPDAEIPDAPPAPLPL